MSMPRETPVDCGGCGQSQLFLEWVSLNATLDKEAKDKLLAGELTQFLCEKCGWTAEVVYPLLYHDMEQKVMIWLVPPGGKVTGDPRTGRAPRDYRCRFVSNRRELVEKILIFDADLDDRVLECIKLVMLSNCAKQNEPIRGPLFFAGVSEESDQPRRIYFQHFTNEGSKGVAAGLESYIDVQAELQDVLPTAEAEGGQWLMVNDAYLANLSGDGGTP
jgi:hypothetical protein